MKVILSEDVKGIGKKLQTVNVSEGYARNYLLPKKLAILADNKASSEARTKLESQKFKKQTEINAANELKLKIEKSNIEFRHKTGEAGKLFGSVTEKEIAEKIKEKFNIQISKKKIEIKTQIKQTGTYTVSIKLYEGISANLKVTVNAI
ncbi:MAG: 50S ribosomal protein L9 [Clostridia bacterium]